MVYDSSKQDNINLIDLLQGDKMINNCGGDKQAYLRQMMFPASNIAAENQSSRPIETRAILTALKHDHFSTVNNLTSPPPIVSSSTGLHHHQSDMMNKAGTFMFDRNAVPVEQQQTHSRLPPVSTIINDHSISRRNEIIAGSGIQDNNICDPSNMAASSFTTVDDHHIDFFNHVDSTVDDDDESNLNYLPYGCYYQDKMLNQLISPIATSNHSSPAFSHPVGPSSSSFSTEASFPFDKFDSQLLYDPQDQLVQYPDDSEFDLNGNIDCDNFIAEGLFENDTNNKENFVINTKNDGQLQTSYEMIFQFDDPMNVGDGCFDSGLGSTFMIDPKKTIKSEPTLAQLNSGIVKEEDENWLSYSNQAPANRVPSNPVSITNQQQQNTISSTSSPVLQIVSGGLSHSPNLNPNVSSSDELIVMTDPGDDTSLEIQSILKLNHGQRHFLNGSVIPSPPQISSSLQHTKLAQSNLAKPNFISQNGQKTLLSKLLSSEITNDELLRRNDPATATNLVLANSMMSIVSSTANNNAKFQQNKNMNCPTLQALITNTPGGSSMSPMLGSQAVSLGSFTPLSCNVSLNTLLNNNNNRMRNHSMSTDYSTSSHDEGFASQPDEESEESDGDNADNASINGLMLLVNENIDTDMFYSPQQQQQQQHQLVTSTPTTLNVSIVNNNALNVGAQFVPDMTLVNGSPTIKQEVFWNNSNHQNIQFKPDDVPGYHPASTSAPSTSSIADDNDDQAMSSYDDDDDDESFYGDYDASDLLGATTSDDVNNKWALNMGRSRKGSGKRYFWQYNVQSKGPKGPRLGSISSNDQDEDPLVFKEISDPVFAPDCQVEGVKHSGKARRGDGNDLTPNPKKLVMIGLELKKLSKTINDLSPVTDAPIACRNTKRKEKNKLASRACRLKKKAQHEANKIKLCGLHREHDRLVHIIEELRKLAQLSLNGPMGKAINDFIECNKPKIEVAGHTADFVNHILDNVSAGVTNGGLDTV